MDEELEKFYKQINSNSNLKFLIEFEPINLDFKKSEFNFTIPEDQKIKKEINLFKVSKDNISLDF
jgi:hypothetical protein